MTTALVVPGQGPGAPPLSADLSFVGVEPTIVQECAQLVQTSVAIAPEIVIIYDQAPGTALFDATAALRTVAPRPVIVFTADPDADKISLALSAGIHAYVVNGYSQGRLRSVIHLARARFRREQGLEDELADISRRFAERKLVDRAKGILMGARQLREDEAYRVLRRNAMGSKQRIGQVSQGVIEAARYAEAVNRAGQLRMLSQRAVKLFALRCLRVEAPAAERLGAATAALAEENLLTLGRSVSRPTFGDLLDAAAAAWAGLREALAAPTGPQAAAAADRRAEAMLAASERLTANLELAGATATLRVINVAGRQRMLSQRIAKDALLARLAGASPAARAERNELVQALADLRAAPLNNPAIAADLGRAAATWAEFEAALAAPDGIARAAALSETLLELFDRVTTAFERGMHAMM